MVYPVRPKFSATTVLRSVVVCSSTTTASHCIYSIHITLPFHQLTELQIQAEAETNDAVAAGRKAVVASSRVIRAIVVTATPTHARASNTAIRAT